MRVATRTSFSSARRGFGFFLEMVLVFVRAFAMPFFAGWNCNPHYSVLLCVEKPPSARIAARDITHAFHVLQWLQSDNGCGVALEQVKVRLNRCAGGILWRGQEKGAARIGEYGQAFRRTHDAKDPGPSGC
ncbi:MAG TPA: hypothetical protein VH189_13200, partial [Rhizomicrobium sp.]|nr:hypothetical protein [Rhizomicrobium sp.]